MDDVEKLIADVSNRSVWQEESVHSRAASVLNSRLVYTGISVVLAAVLITVLVLVGVMVGRRDPDVSAAVRHLFIEVDSERLPVLPQHYPGTDHRDWRTPDLVLAVGDGWAGGLGVSDTADDSWWAKLRSRHRQFEKVTVVRSVNASAVAADLPALIARLKLPSTLQGRNVALVVQVGWNDVIQRADTLDMRVLVESLMASIDAAVKGVPAFQRAASLSVYVLDYADPSAGSGFTDLPCTPPLDVVYNHAGAADTHLRALAMLSRGLMVEAHAHGYAFVPLRATLANVGAAGVVRSMAVAGGRSAAVDVLGKRLPSPAPAAFDKFCDSLGAAGQTYQADLLAAYMSNQAYFIVG